MESLKLLQEEHRMQDLPVILFTASPSIDNLVAGLKDKNLGMLTKPVSLGELQDGIGKFLGPR